MTTKRARLNLVGSQEKNGIQERKPPEPLLTLDLFCGAGGITEGFRQTGYRCLYGNDCVPEAFSLNHPEAWGDVRDFEEVDPAHVRRRLHAFVRRELGHQGTGSIRNSSPTLVFHLT